MTSFLQLCEQLADDSGGSGRAPITVTGQVGRQKKLVNWVRDAWISVQNSKSNWSFLRGEWTGALIPNAQTYTCNSWPIPRFGEWIGDYGRHRTTSLYDPDIGPADQADLQIISWEEWKRRWDYGVHDANRPYEYCLAPDGSIRFGPKPDKAYVARGEYRKTPQILAANNDEPDMPARFHKVIVWRAIQLMAKHDEAVTALGLANTEYADLITQMARDCLPSFNVRAGRPLA